MPFSGCHQEVCKKKILYTGSNFLAKASRPLPPPTICSKRFSCSRWEIPPSGCLLSHIGIFSLIFCLSIHMIGSILHTDIHLASILRFLRHCWKRQKWWYCILQCNL